MERVIKIGTKPADIRIEGRKELTLEYLQEAVGGYIEPCAPVELRKRGIEMLANEEGLLAGLDCNTNLFPFFYVGNLIMVGVKGEEFTGLNDAQLAFACTWLLNLGE